MSQPPTDIQAQTATGCLQISWADHPTWSFPFSYVRENCNCAVCVDEFTGERLIDPDTIPADIHVEKMELVGSYSIRITWSDSHNSGLFTWKRLRELCRCNECVVAQTAQ